MSTIRWFNTLTVKDVPIVGGKNASLGEMIRTLQPEGIYVPNGFATTADAYWMFIDTNDLAKKIADELERWHKGEQSLQQAGATIRRLIRNAVLPEALTEELVKAYRSLSQEYKMDAVDVAVRSSATAEDLPQASFAGQQETFLNVHGESELLQAVRNCYASLFTDRAIVYREEQGFDHMKIALSAGVQKMVRSDKASSGVMFTLDTETGFPDVVVINGTWGLGENVVQGAVNPDEYAVFKPLLSKKGYKPIIKKDLGAKEQKMVYATGGTRAVKNVTTSHDERSMFVLNDEEIIQLATWACAIETHYGRPMDIEWAKDGETGKLFIVQARPETVQSRSEASSLKTYTLKEHGPRLLTGMSIGTAIAAAKACVIKSADEIQMFEPGAILVTGMTDPDWVPIMKQAAGIITDFGGRTSHAAIVSRELGIPAIVGTGEATKVLHDEQLITLSCAEGDHGFVYDGILNYEEKILNLEDLPKLRTRIMMNVGDPDAAFRWWRLPTHGIGLARMEFIINNFIKIHPMALVRFEQLKDEKVKRTIAKLTAGYTDKTEYFVERLARGIARIAASQYPEPVIVRMSDFKTNEYANLIGGLEFEPKEENPMLGFRGASRYYDPRYREGFALECKAIKRVREEIGLDNVVVMIPFCRTLGEADQVLDVMESNGLKRGENGLKVYVMAEIPSNVILAQEFAKRFDGFSIGSNDLTQLVLGVDRDSGELAGLFDERNEAIKTMIRLLLENAHAAGRPVGICGQAPSDYPDFAAFLVEYGIDSISLNPDSVLTVIQRVAQQEKLIPPKSVTMEKPVPPSKVTKPFSAIVG
ncbi:MAG: phosphoenolpyruvate synthase [Caldilineaceae bacterium]